ncbi:MAG: hypothetical protein H7A24_07130 [Leptospiraceae bacterium]|nr:hypothetical protein [Leptospiraceae bacterium]MCP5511637.1 hypothetical protein [Leptospiraceae bacterium]
MRFQNHPIIKEFNGIKKFFRKNETHISRKRMEDLKKFTEVIGESGDTIAFDIMGSVNFGQAIEYSDMDIVYYIKCDNNSIEDCLTEDCGRFKIYKELLINSLIYEYSSQSYPIQIVDCLNLNQVEHDIKIRNFESLALIKFGFYRSVCRGVNRKVLHFYEQLLEEDEELCNVIESSIAECFLGLIHSNSHSYSFKKYMERLEFNGSKIPSSILEKITTYLNK